MIFLHQSEHNFLEKRNDPWKLKAFVIPDYCLFQILLKLDKSLTDNVAPKQVTNIILNNRIESKQ